MMLCALHLTGLFLPECLDNSKSCPSSGRAHTLLPHMQTGFPDMLLCSADPPVFWTGIFKPREVIFPQMPPSSVNPAHGQSTEGSWGWSGCSPDLAPTAWAGKSQRAAELPGGNWCSQHPKFQFVCVWLQLQRQRASAQMGKGLFRALLDTSSQGCAEQLLTRVTGFSAAAGELFTGRGSYKRHSPAGSSLCFVPLRDGGDVMLKPLMCLRVEKEHYINAT